jgi:steroid delta-isomerase-like uncharacterized protein
VSLAENKALVRRYWDEVVNPGNLDLIDALFAPDYVLHTPDGDVPGRDGIRQQLTAFRAAFPDLRAEVADEVAEGDKVVQWVLARGTHRGELFGVPPTGKSVTITGIVISRVAAGKIAEEWEVLDLLGVLQQIGAVPTPGSSGA